MTIGKSFDTHGPLGPWLVTPDELGDPHDLRIRTFVNDELRQDGNTARDGLRLLPAGRPPLRSLHARARRRDRHRHPGRRRRRPPAVPRGLLKVGDTVRVEIDGIGELATRSSRSPRATWRPRPRRGGMGELTAELRALLDANAVGVLATVARTAAPAVARLLRARRRPPADLDAGRRLKARDVQRAGWASLCVMGHEPPYPSAMFSGPAEILTEDIGAADGAASRSGSPAPTSRPSR